MRLSFRQEDLGWQGHAIECRVYAEDPENNFFPSPGRITFLRVPAGPGIRDDSGVSEGDEVSIYYDPMISKLAAWGRTRDEAIDRLRRTGRIRGRVIKTRAFCGRSCAMTSSMPDTWTPVSFRVQRTPIRVGMGVTRKMRVPQREKWRSRGRTGVCARAAPEPAVITARTE